MSELDLHTWLVRALFVLAALTFLSLCFRAAPYGRHIERGWGPHLDSRWGWVLMEAPACVVFAVVFALGDHAHQTVPLLLLVVWQVHYFHRSFVFPFRIPGGGKSLPLAIAAMGASFNTLNGYLNARWVSHLGSYDEAWLDDLRLWVGLGIFVVGLVINIRADNVLFALRRAGQGYQVPRGGLYEWIVSPNYLGEILEWVGWAVLTWSWAGLAFALYTAANLVPRARAHLAWYRKTFPDFPAERRAILPKVW